MNEEAGSEFSIITVKFRKISPLTRIRKAAARLKAVNCANDSEEGN